MRYDLTELVFILDKSGSMHELVEDTIGGFNSMIEQQKKEPGEARITTVLFDNNYYILHNDMDIKEIEPISEEEYRPGGMTALLDAVGKTINDIGIKLKNIPEEERPGKVVVVIMTDGYENSSREYSRETVKKMIEHQQEKYSWTFIFLGADIDAASEASSIGIDSGWSRTYTKSSAGQSSAYTAVTDSLSAVRNVGYSYAMSMNSSNSEGVSTSCSNGESSSVGCQMSKEEMEKKMEDEAKKALDSVI